MDSNDREVKGAGCITLLIGACAFSVNVCMGGTVVLLYEWNPITFLTVLTLAICVTGGLYVIHQEVQGVYKLFAIIVEGMQFLFTLIFDKKKSLPKRLDPEVPDNNHTKPASED